MGPNNVTGGTHGERDRRTKLGGSVTGTGTDAGSDAGTGGSVNPWSAGTSYACVASHLHDADSIRSWTG